MHVNAYGCTSRKIMTIYIYIALYLAVNGPERSSRFYVFYNTLIHCILWLLLLAIAYSALVHSM